MTKVVVDPSTLARLCQERQATELCDDAGHVVGHFIPIFDRSQFEDLEPQVSEEELIRREKKGGGRPLTAILADLEKQP